MRGWTWTLRVEMGEGDRLAGYVPQAASWRSKGLPPPHPTSTGGASAGGESTGGVSAGTAVVGHDLFDGRALLPTMVLLESALQHNIALLSSWFGDRGLSYAPHGKTTMSPQIWRLQLEAGAWAITVATAWQASIAAAVGVPRIVIANEVVDAGGLAWLRHASDAPGPELVVQVDSIEGVGLMARVLARSTRRLPVLLDVGQVGGRTGVRTAEEALAVGRAVVQAEPLRLSGLTFFEGAAPGATPGEKHQNVLGLLGFVRDVARLLAADIRADGADEVILSGGGSKSFDLVSDELARPLELDLPVRVVIRSGSAVIHDHDLYHATSPLRARAAGLPALRPAIEIWAPVLSTPERGLAILGAGRRDLPYDAGLPTVIKVRSGEGVMEPAAGIALTALNDQHAFAALEPDVHLEVGDLVGLGISHPCSAFDRWRWIPVVDDDYRILDVFDTIF